MLYIHIQQQSFLIITVMLLKCTPSKPLDIYLYRVIPDMGVPMHSVKYCYIVFRNHCTDFFQFFLIFNSLLRLSCNFQ